MSFLLVFSAFQEHVLGKRKSFVDDLIKERGIVSMWVALCYELLRFIPCSIRFVNSFLDEKFFSSSVARIHIILLVSTVNWTWFIISYVRVNGALNWVLFTRIFFSSKISSLGLASWCLTTLRTCSFFTKCFHFRLSLLTFHFGILRFHFGTSTFSLRTCERFWTWCCQLTLWSLYRFYDARANGSLSWVLFALAFFFV